jgi:large subunit ribosomal protein L21e
MANRKGGFRRRTRYKFKKALRAKGKISQKAFFQKLDMGDKVQLSAESAYQKGMYYPRYHGLVGVVKEKKGTCYCVEIHDQNMPKLLIVHPIHLRKIA